MESIIMHYQVAHVGFSLSYPDSSQDMMAVLLEAYQAFECDEQVSSAALTSFSLTLNESGEELRKPAGFKEECRQDEEGQLIISGSLGEKQKAFLMAMTDMKSILVQVMIISIPVFWFLLAPSARSRLSDPSRQPLTPR